MPSADTDDLSDPARLRLTEPLTGTQLVFAVYGPYQAALRQDRRREHCLTREVAPGQGAAPRRTASNQLAAPA